MKVYGYCRVSTQMQSIKRQIENIKAEYPDAIIFDEAFTGTKMDRPKWNKLYKAAKAGDVIVFDSVSRMARDAAEGFKCYEELFRRGVELIFLKEHHIDTAIYRKAIEGQIQLAINSGNKATDTLIGDIGEAINRYLLALAKAQIQLAFDQSEKEVDDLHVRTREGIAQVKKHNDELKVLYPDDYEDHKEYKQIGQKKGTKLTTKKSVKAKEIILNRSKDFNGELTDPEMIILTGLARGTYYKYKRELKEGI